MSGIYITISHSFNLIFYLVSRVWWTFWCVMSGNYINISHSFNLIICIVSRVLWIFWCVLCLLQINKVLGFNGINSGLKRWNSEQKMAKTEIYYTRHEMQSKFLVLDNVRILAITLSSDVRLSWFKLQIK